VETVTFYSYKGGSGRTLLLANAARYLALSGKKVVAVDLDFEAPGLHYKLHIGRSGERTAEVVPERGAVDYLLATHANEEPVNPTDFLTEVPLPLDSTGRLYLMPAGSAPSAEYWRALTSLSRHALLSDSDGETPLAGLLELKARVEDELEADVLLIDARTGITELGGIATTILPDKVVCLLLDNQESLTGARTVIRSFAHATRLNDQQPIEVVLVLSRVPDPTPALKERVLEFLNEDQQGQDSAGGFEQLFILRDDRDLAEEEHLFFEGYEPPPVREGPGIRGLRLPPPDLSQGLGRDYVELIGALFSSDSAAEPAAFRRQQATREMREWLTEDESHRRHRSMFPRAFDSKQIDEGVKLDDQGLHYVDLLAYSNDRAPLVAALYSEDLEPLKNWEWPRAGVRCVFLFNLDDKGHLQTKAFTRGRIGGFTEVSDPPDSHRDVEWTLNKPAVYAALPDPGDQSITALLASVQNGDDTFIALLVREWQHASYMTLHGGMPFRPLLAREIIDGLAAVNDVETATRILWRTAPDPFERADEGMMHEGASLEEMTSRDLHAPLFWRLPVAAKVQYWQHGRERTTTAGFEMLARDMIGLRFDQDQDLREEAERLVKMAPVPKALQPRDENGDDLKLEYLESVFRERELKFEFSTGASPEMIRRVMIGTLAPDRPKIATWQQAEALAETALESGAALAVLLRDETGHRSIVTTNLLARYEPANATVTLFSRLLEWSASTLDVPLRDLENVVFLHETIHAVCHLGRDLDGRHWSEFALPSSRDLTFTPSELHETLAQYFTLRMIERLGDAGMMRAFEVLSDYQPKQYQAWRAMRSTPIEQVRKLLIEVRTGFAAQQ
jgi:cellulose biosynthesis protein BcsQ